MNPSALIFDLDGTLADTMPAHYAAWCAVAPRYGLVFPEKRFYELAGWPTRYIAKLLAGEQGVTLDPVAYSNDKNQYFLDHLEDVKAIEPVMAIVKAHFGILPMAVATGSRRRNAMEVIRRIAAESLFDAVVTSEDVEAPKPAPDVFLEAARRLGVAPEKCRVYEDGDSGLQGARAAGMEAVDVRELLASLDQRRYGRGSL